MVMFSLGSNGRFDGWPWRLWPRQERRKVSEDRRRRLLAGHTFPLAGLWLLLNTTRRLTRGGGGSMFWNWFLVDVGRASCRLPDREMQCRKMAADILQRGAGSGDAVPQDGDDFLQRIVMGSSYQATKRRTVSSRYTRAFSVSHFRSDLSHGNFEIS